jgi:hypothetical protein
MVCAFATPLQGPANATTATSAARTGARLARRFSLELDMFRAVTDLLP